MRKKHMAILCIVGLLTTISYLQYGREPDVCGTKIESFVDGYYEKVSIVSNKIYLFNKEAFARQIVREIRDNTLKNVMFSYDLQGYPNGLFISVYMNKSAYREGKRNFEITYLQDTKYGFQYNIKNSPDKFALEISP